MGTTPNLRWGVILPVALVAIAVIVALIFDAAHGGEARPAPLLGDLGTPVRSQFLQPVPSPTGQPTPRPVVTSPARPGLKGTPAERDAQRRADLLRLLDAALRLKERDGAYPDTKKNAQTVCVFKDNDLGCAFKDTYGGDLPSDPAGDPAHNGYFYSSDGATAIFYAALEEEIPDDQRCVTTDKGLQDRANLLCVTAP